MAKPTLLVLLELQPVKTLLRCAMSVYQTCLMNWRLLMEGTFEKVIKSYQKIDLLILDEFLLSPLGSDQARELLEIIEACSVQDSVIFCTQFEPSGWYTRIGDERDVTICEAIIDRIVIN